jgi:hypothetical protein
MNKNPFTPTSSIQRHRESIKAGALYNPFKPIEIKNPIETAKDYYNEASRLVYGNTDYPTKARQTLEKFANEPIQKITLIRNPVPDYLIELLNIASFGDFKKKLKETEYDKLFHLAIVFDTPKGRVLVEKNEVVNISETIPNEEGREDRNVPMNGKSLRFKDILDKTEQRLGKDKYFKYSAYDNNCQNFILNLLKANNLGDENDYEWVKQDTEELFKTNPYLRKLSNTITDVASRFTGRGKVGGLIVKRNPYNSW